MNNDDEQLWQAELEGVKPLRAKITSEKKSLNIRFMQNDDAAKINHTPIMESSLKAQIVQLKQVNYPNYDRETPTIRLSKIDATLLRGLRLNRLHISHKIDLHDMSVALAHEQLLGFLRDAWSAQTKVALVITGKGSAGKIGELRRNLPRWCVEPHFQPMVVALQQAYKHHGGDGAFYVQIRRNNI